MATLTLDGVHSLPGYGQWWRQRRAQRCKGRAPVGWSFGGWHVGGLRLGIMGLSSSCGNEFRGGFHGHCIRRWT
jgi:hypothetical protein